MLNMEKRYYTPQIDELFVGYQCEKLDYSKVPEEIWIPYILPEYKEINTYTKIKTKYLDSEDIEKEGFKLLYKINNKNSRDFPEGEISCFIMGKYVSLYFHKNTNLVHIQNKGLYYKGGCKSINEFRKICKWLNIK